MFYPPCPGYNPAGYDLPFTPRYSVPESFRRALSYEGQVHWLAGLYDRFESMVESNVNFWVVDSTDSFDRETADGFLNKKHAFDVTWPADGPVSGTDVTVATGDVVAVRSTDTTDGGMCFLMGNVVDACRGVTPERWNVAVRMVVHDLTAKFDELSVKVDRVETKVDGFDTRINTVETKVIRLDALVAEVTTDVSNLKTDVAKLQTGQTGLQKRVAYNESAIDALSNNTDYSFVYIATYGSDSNDGLTRDTPVKTLSHAFKVARGVLNPSNFEFVILDNSTYTATIGGLCNKSIHIIAERGATIDLHSKSGTRIPVYNCYLDFSGKSESTRLVVNFSTGFHMDSTFLWSQYATFKVSGGKFDVQGGAIRLENCILDSTEALVLNSSNAAFVNTDVRCTPEQNTIIGQGSLVMFQACTFTNPESKALALVMSGCFVSLIRLSHYVGTMPSAGFLSLNTSHAVMQKDFKDSIPDFSVKGYSSSICKSASLYVME